jgi:hypothetical protein
VYELAGADGCMSLPFPLLVGRKTTILLCCHHGIWPDPKSRPMQAFLRCPKEKAGPPRTKPARAVLNPRPSASLLVRFPRRCSLPHPLLPPKPSLPPSPTTTASKGGRRTPTRPPPRMAPLLRPPPPPPRLRALLRRLLSTGAGPVPSRMLHLSLRSTAAAPRFLFGPRCALASPSYYLPRWSLRANGSVAFFLSSRS